MVPKIMIEEGHAWVHERPIAAARAVVDLCSESSVVVHIMKIRFSPV
jgi:hypothetical protein|eukprot:SAG25_NODE_46_length_19040_cov_20.665699_23_plen_47_part_00